MSRWKDQANDPGFLEQWKSIRSLVAATKPDDASQLPAVAEIARLKKVIAFVDGLLKSLDADLMPLSTWENFREQATQLSSHVSAFAENRNIVHIQKANYLADSLLVYTRPYVVATGKIGAALKEAVTEYSAAYEEYAKSYGVLTGKIATELEAQLDNATSGSAEVLAARDRVNAAIQTLLGDNNREGIVAKAVRQVADVEKKHEQVAALHHEIFVGEGDASIKKSISDAATSANSDSQAIGSLLKSTRTQLAALNAVHTKMLGVPNEEGVLKGGLSDEVDSQRARMLAFEDEQKVKYAALNEQIESLLPGATSAGLASAYRELKDSFEKPIRFASRVFFSAIATLILGSLILTVQKVSLSGIEFVPMSDWNSVLRDLAHKIPYYLPLVWLAYFATKRRSEYQRLQQEYAHKEALAKSYQSYRKQIAELGEKNNELQKALLLNAIEAIARNPSETLDGTHGDKMPAHVVAEEAIKALDSPSLIARLKEKLGD